MILVAGLVIAGLVGIGAAFYYSVRRGSSGVRAGTRPGRAGSARFAGSRTRDSRPSSSAAARSSSSARTAGSTSSRASGRTGLEPMTSSAAADPAPLVADRRPHRDASTGPRRRLAWRKGADIDQEFWPIETFGGVSDEQFWDDLAADKLLATSRTAQADIGPGTRAARAYPADASAADAGPA